VESENVIHIAYGPPHLHGPFIWHAHDLVKVPKKALNKSTVWYKTISKARGKRALY